ncbi:MAG: CapA family protein [Clostridia bacterium]|nr:CapA family protein [Clostridia bacterium]
MRKKLGIILIIVVIFDIIALGIVAVDKFVNRKSPVAQVTDTESGEGETGLASGELISTVSFVAVGDNLIHNTIYEQAKARTTDGSYDFSYAYEKIAPYIAEPDIAVLNQETLISTEHGVSSYPMFNSPPELGQQMIDLGFDVFNICTNHSLDKGESGLISAINYWKEKGVITTGAYLNEEDFKIPVNTVNGVKFAYLGFTENTNGLSLPADSDVILVMESDEDLIKSKVEEAKKIADVVIVNAHWGEEYTHTPTASEKSMAQKLCDWGVDIVLGTHPHVIQPVEFITSTDGSHQMLCAYSLGNFISAQNKGPTMLGGMLSFNVVKNNSTGVINIENVRFRGTVTHYGSGMSNVRVYCLDDYTEELAASHGRNVNMSFTLDYLRNLLEEVIDKQFLE